MSDSLVWRRIVGVTIQRVGPVLRNEAEGLGENVRCLKAESSGRLKRNLRLHRVEVGFAEISEVIGGGQLRIGDDVVFRKTSRRNVGRRGCSRGIVQTRRKAVAT